VGSRLSPRLFSNEIILFNRAVTTQKNMYYRALLEFSERQNAGENVQAEMMFTKTKRNGNRTTENKQFGPHLESKCFE
jgi:hypothetical protein